MTSFWPGRIIWIFGRSGSGKTTLGRMLAQHMSALLLDADVVRQVHNITPDFSASGRLKFQELLRGQARRLSMRGNDIVVSSITPLQSMRNANRHELRHYFEVYLSCRMDILKERDPKGLYKKYMEGELDTIALFEKPSYAVDPLDSIPDIEIATDNFSVSESFKGLIHYVDRYLEQTTF